MMNYRDQLLLDLEVEGWEDFWKTGSYNPNAGGGDAGLQAAYDVGWNAAENSDLNARKKYHGMGSTE